MAPTYKPYYFTRPHLTTHITTWAESQANFILNLRDVSYPPTRTPDPDVEGFDTDSQIHARWNDPDLVLALTQLQESIDGKVKLELKYGGRDVTASTWVTVHEIRPGALPELKYVLWFHEYDDLAVEVGELSGVQWGKGVKKEKGREEGQVGLEVTGTGKDGEVVKGIGKKWGGKQKQQQEEVVEVKMEVADA